MFGFQSSEEVIGKPVNLLIPSLKLPALVEELPKVRYNLFVFVSTENVQWAEIIVYLIS